MSEQILVPVCCSFDVELAFDRAIEQMPDGPTKKDLTFIRELIPAMGPDREEDEAWFLRLIDADLCKSARDIALFIIKSMSVTYDDYCAGKRPAIPHMAGIRDSEHQR